MSTPAVITPTPVDLTTLDNVKSWLEIALENHNDDSDIQDAITGFSQWILTMSGIACFNQVNQYTETRSGNGNNQIFLRNRPIISVASLSISGVAIPSSSSYNTWGYYISDDGKSIYLRPSGNPVGFGSLCRGGFYGSGGAGFTRGRGNIQIVYTAGYTRVPSDLEFAVRRAVAINYRRKSTLDLATRSVAAGGTTGTTRYRDWKIPPELCDVFDNYSRNAII